MNISTKLILALTLLFTFAGQTKAEDVNDWITQQLRYSLDLRFVDYDEMYNKAMNNEKIDRLLYFLTLIDFCDAYGVDSLAVALIDTVLVKGSDEELKDGNAAYLLRKKYFKMLLQNRYDEIERMACYIEGRWLNNSTLMGWASHWHLMAKAGKDIKPVSIRREKNVVRLAPKNLNGHMCIKVDVNQFKDARFIIDTGLLSSTTISRKLAKKIGVRLLPDSVMVSTADDTNIQYYMYHGIVDSLKIDGITFYNLPVKVSDEVVGKSCDGMIGAPDLIRLEYMELSYDSIVFRYPVPENTGEANLVMNAGERGDRSITLPYTIDGHKGSFILDTGTDSFMLPPQYAERKEAFLVEIGGMNIWMEGKFEPHDYVPHMDSRSWLGRPILKSFERLCFNFRDAHVDYILKPDINHTEYHYDETQLK